MFIFLIFLLVLNYEVETTSEAHRREQNDFLEQTYRSWSRKERSFEINSFEEETRFETWASNYQKVRASKFCDREFQQCSFNFSYAKRLCP